MRKGILIRGVGILGIHHNKATKKYFLEGGNKGWRETQQRILQENTSIEIKKKKSQTNQKSIPPQELYLALNGRLPVKTKQSKKKQNPKKTLTS